MQGHDVWRDKDVVREYAKFSGSRKEGWHEYEIAFPKMLGMFPEGNDLAVLDYGCGPGDFAAELSKRYSDVVAVDTSQAMIDAAREKYPEISSFVWDYKKPFPKGKKFDVVFAKLVLHFIDDLYEFARAMNVLLKDRGVISISVIHPEKSKPYVEGYFGVIPYLRETKSTEEKTRFIHRNFEEYVEPFVRSGFVLIGLYETEITRELAAKYDVPEEKAKKPKQLILGFAKV